MPFLNSLYPHPPIPVQFQTCHNSFIFFLKVFFYLCLWLYATLQCLFQAFPQPRVLSTLRLWSTPTRAAQ